MMGEYANYNGKEIKIGTCEDLYYLRADQRHLVIPRDGSLDPNDPKVQKFIRFRFPFPEEDKLNPGQFDNPFKSVGLYGVTVPEEVEHSKSQFSNQRGYWISLPCPESKEGQELGHRFAKNGRPGPVRIVQQGFREGNLALICQCGGCGTPYNLPTLEDAQPVIDALQKCADSTHPQNGTSHKIYHEEIIARIKAGYEDGAGR